MVGLDLEALLHDSMGWKCFSVYDCEKVEWNMASCLVRLEGKKAVQDLQPGRAFPSLSPGDQLPSAVGALHHLGFHTALPQELHAELLRLWAPQLCFKAENYPRLNSLQ